MASVRAAHDGDVADIHDICLRAYVATYDGVAPESYWRRMLAEHYTPARVAKSIAAQPPGWLGYQVVEESGRVRGFAAGGLVPASAFPTSPSEVLGELHVLYLDPEDLGRGLGTLLLDRVTGQLRNRGATAIGAAALAGNTKAIPFYQARGFTPIGRRRAAGSSEAEDVWSVLLLRRLSPK
ncbi:MULTISPECIES: GNAT family N-acetyltransferase [Actinoplanes]|uniref:GNAT family N-acetyltransferase n=1 Tax=Actinoplanes TaxID=1865 RepID=UPI0006989C74|nr:MULTISPECIES: GNAT family N-acetyltransferase [Actinoplanes]GLY01329.1 hypothetical protein Acsp01_17080 [Actinoplanes sp. NBRC 101535]